MGVLLNRTIPSTEFNMFPGNKSNNRLINLSYETIVCQLLMIVLRNWKF